MDKSGMLITNDIAVIRLGKWKPMVLGEPMHPQHQSNSLIAKLPQAENDEIIGPIKAQGYGKRGKQFNTKVYADLGILEKHTPFTPSFTDGTGPSKFKPCLR